MAGASENVETEAQHEAKAGHSSGTGNNGTHSPSWTGNPTIGEGHGDLSNDNPVDVPAVPSNGDGDSDGTAVSTPSMDVFAHNIGRLIQPVMDAHEALAPIHIAPGAFYHANMMESDITGFNGDSGLKRQFEDALLALKDGLTELSEGVLTLSSTFQTTEDANNMEASDFQNAVSSAVSEFNAMMQAQQGQGNASFGGSQATPTPAA